MNSFFSWSVLVGAAASSAVACDLCRVYNAPLAHHVFDPGFHGGVAEQFTHFGTLQENGSKVPNPLRQRLDSSISQLVAGYQFTDGVGLQFNLPVIHRAFRRAHDDGVESGHESGIGDAALLADWVVFRRDREQWGLAFQILGGVKFPTGDSDRLEEELREEEGEPGHESGIHGHDLALGSGSWDGLFGAELYTRWQRFYFTAGVQYALRSEGDFGYRYANDLAWAGGPGFYLIFGEEWTVGLQASVTGETKGRDERRGETAEDTAITAVYLGPLVSVSWKGKLTAEIGAALPVHIWNSALQAVPDYRITASLSWRF